MTIVQLSSATAVILAGVVLVASGPASALKSISFGHAGQPTPVVSVTTLPAMPGSATMAPAAAPSTPAPGPPEVRSADAYAIISVTGDVNKPVTFTLKDLERMRQTSLALNVGPDGTKGLHTYTGVLLSEILDRAQPRSGNDPSVLQRKYVYVVGIDGRSAIVAFPEFMPELNAKKIILAYLVDLKNLSTPGFAVLVVPEDKGGGRFLAVSRLIVGEPAH